MKLFKSLRKHFKELGFSRSQRPFNRRHLSLYFKGSVIFFSFCMYLCFVGNTNVEYMSSLYMISVGLTTFGSFTSIILRAPIIYRFFDDIETVINSSELTLYSKKLIPKRLECLIGLRTIFLRIGTPSIKSNLHKSQSINQKTEQINLFIHGKCGTGFLGVAKSFCQLC